MESAAGHPQTPPPMGSVAGHPQTPAPVAPQSPASFGTPPQMATPAAGYQPPPAVTPHPGGRTIPVGAPSHAAPASHAPSHVAPSHVTPSHAPSHAPSHVTPPSHITPHHLTPHPPRSYVPAHAPPRQSKAWLWAVLALLVAGGAGTGVYLATRSGDQVAAADDKKSKSSDDDDDDKSDDDIEKSDDDTDKSDDDTDIHAIGDDGEDTDDGDDGDDDEPGKVSSDFNTGAKRDFYGAKGARAGVTGQRFDSPLGFSFVAPDGFAQATDGQLTTYTGKLNGGDTMILLFGVDVTGMPVSDADLAQVGDGIALTSGGEVISTKRRTVQGVSRVAGKFDVPANGTRGEYVVFHEANLVVIVAIAAPKHLFSRSETFRTEIYERRLAMP
jgi:hypothetical protein